MVDPSGTREQPPTSIVIREGSRSATLRRLPETVAALRPRLDAPAVVLVRVAAPTPVSVAVVDAVVDLLHDVGCPEVIVAARVTTGDRDRGHQSLPELLAAAGLTGRTTAGNAYAVEDLAGGLVPAPVPPTSVLSGHRVAGSWSAARTRVLVTRAVTDLVDGFAASLDTLGTAAPELPGAEPADVVSDLAAHLPVDLVVVDALDIAAGADGARLPRWVAADTLVVADDPVQADTAVAVLLGQDRCASRLVSRALAARDTRLGRTIGLGPPMADGPPPRTRAAARALAGDPRLERVLRAGVGGPDDGADPTDRVLDIVREVLTPLVAEADRSPGVATALESLLLLAHGAAHLGSSWAVGFDKDAVPRREVPLGFDPAQQPDAAYDGLPGFLAPFADLLAGVESDADGLALRMVDGATVFEVSREVATPFDDFVARVDVAAGISLMADYIGGRRVPVAGGPGPARVRQAERNLYLPQPNYLAVWGGHVIDVCKVELVERDADRHRLLWRTVLSPNGSAEADDGILTFARTRRGVRVSVLGRQRFALPPAWAAVDLDAWPEVRDPLLREAYRRFFTATFDNLEACYEGREFRVGRPAPGPDETLLTAAVELIVAAAREWLAERAPRPGARAVVVDDDGFTHVRGPR